MHPFSAVGDNWWLAVQVVTRLLKSAQELDIENHYVKSWSPLGLVG